MSNIPVVTRDYRDIFSYKDAAFNVLGPKYYPNTNLSNLNIGLTGYVLEQMGNISEDSFNTISTLIKEMFPNRAQIPESIYSYAAMFQLSNAFSNAAECKFLLVFEEEVLRELLSAANANSQNNNGKIYLDKDTKIIVEDIIFVLDYDIEITMRKINGEYVYSAKYVTIPFTNTISSIENPYIKVRKSKDGYLALEIIGRQCYREEVTQSIIDNTKINYPTLDFEFEGRLSGFDIFYKSPDDEDFNTQLKALVLNSEPLKDEKFCYYKMVDDNCLRISFSTMEHYFQPEFNSEVKLIIYTTDGEDGNFDVYNGSNIEVICNSERYAYNMNLVLSAKPTTSSLGGKNKLSLEELQSIVVEQFSSAKAITTDYDLETYFYNYQFKYNNKIKFIKRRDDFAERLFGGYLIMQQDDYVFPTNTLDLSVNYNDLSNPDNDVIYTIHPGTIFKYEDGRNDRVVPVFKEENSLMTVYDRELVWDMVKNNPKEFYFTNPFLISITTDPNVVGYYLTTTNQYSLVDFTNYNPDSFLQFIMNQVHVERTLDNYGKYDLSIKILPSISWDVDTLVPNLNDRETMKENFLRVIAVICDNNGQELCYTELCPTSVDLEDQVQFKSFIRTDDQVTNSKKFRIINDPDDGDTIVYMSNTVSKLIPMDNVNIKIYTLYKNPDETQRASGNNKFIQYDETLSDYLWTNEYTTESDLITFIKPLDMIRSTVIFRDYRQEGIKLGDSYVYSIPMLKYDLLIHKDELGNDNTNIIDKYNYFIDKYLLQYENLELVLTSTLRNTTHLDLKFYNTYGKSKNYLIGDTEEIIDRVNLSIAFDIYLITGTDQINAKKEIKTFIKNTIEQVNTDGTNELYISNLIREMENTFAYIDHLKFKGINDYSTDYQTIKNITKNINDLNKDERYKYIPEMLVCNTENISLTIYEM